MSSLNKVMLIGNVGDEVKVHSFSDDAKIGRFSLATNETFKTKDGEKKTVTEWHQIVVRNKVCDTCMKYLSKGDKVYLEGKIKTRKWTKEDGTDVYSTEIHAGQVTFLSTKQASNLEVAAPFPTTSNFNTADRDDLPFS